MPIVQPTHESWINEEVIKVSIDGIAVRCGHVDALEAATKLNDTADPEIAGDLEATAEQDHTPVRLAEAVDKGPISHLLEYHTPLQEDVSDEGCFDDTTIDDTSPSSPDSDEAPSLISDDGTSSLTTDDASLSAPETPEHEESPRWITARHILVRSSDTL